MNSRSNMRLYLHPIKKALFVLLINTIAIILLLTIIDIAVTLFSFERNAVSYKDGKIQCASQLTGYNYCPSITQYLYMDKRDKLLPTINYIDKDRHSTYGPKSHAPNITNNRDIFILGDSFIQADELPIEERFEHLLREIGYRVESYGYSSWNSWQFEKIAHTLNVKNGDYVLIFSMTNDYTPSYGSSTIKTLGRFSATLDEYGDKTSKNFLTDYTNQSFLLNQVYPLVKNLFNYENLQPASANKTFDAEKYRTIISSCESLFSNRSLIPSDLMFDYVLLSKESSCWTKEIRKSVDVNIDILKNVQSTLEKKGANVVVFLVPSGWAFENQNTVGRTAKPHYDFPIGTRTTQAELANYMRHKGLDVLDLTEYLESVNNGADTLYFPVDGHWTARAHKEIFNYLKNEFAL